MRTVFIPANDCGIPEGYYDHRAIIALLREHCANPGAVHFIADMLE